jgi:thioredoxin reductase
MYRLIEAEAYKRHRLLVVGGGDSAVEAASALAIQEGNTVTMSYRRGEFVRLKERNERRIAELIRQKQVRVIFNSQVKEIQPAKVLIEEENGPSFEVPSDYTFIFAGGELPGELLKKIGIRLRTGEMTGSSV